MIFRGFHVFEHVLWQKTKTRKRQKLTESLLYKNAACYIDLTILNRPKLFQLFQTSSITVENGLPGFHKRDYTFIHL